MQTNNNVEFGLTIAQFSIYLILCGLCLWKVVQALKRELSFMKILFGIIFVYILWEIGLQTYQLVLQIKDKQINILALVCINIQCIIVETYVMFMLCFYWKKASQTLSNQVQDQFVSKPNQLKYQIGIVFIWNFIFSVFFIYFLASYGSSPVDTVKIESRIILFIGQGITAILFIWAITFQTINGIALLRNLKRYELMVQIPLNKKKFILLVWMTSVINVARIIFLIFITIIIYTESKQEQAWLPLYIFTFTAIFPIIIYIIGFQMNEEEGNNQFDVKTKKTKRDSSSVHETELSASQ